MHDEAQVLFTRRTLDESLLTWFKARRSSYARSHGALPLHRHATVTLACRVHH